MATSYLSPGVYVEEVDRGSKPIEAVGTNTVGFLGESAKGPLNESVLITNWSQFVRTFGDFKDCSEHFAHSVYGFFNNGGSRCFVVNVGAPERCPKPVIAQLHGYCFGVGLELALACDFRVASDDVVLALPELTLGMIPGSGGASRLVRSRQLWCDASPTACSTRP